MEEQLLLHGSDRFEVKYRLGEGAMGVVYCAFDREKNVQVALKTLRELDGETLHRFKQEFRSLQDLDHPNLVSLGELVQTPSQWFFSMELVEGIDVLSWIRGVEPTSLPDMGAMGSGDFVSGTETTHPSWDRPRRRLAFDEQRCRQVLAQLAAGLGALHKAGKVHRDLKPSNVLVTRDGRVVILDFGLVGEVSQRNEEIVGTVAYMAPEQAAGRQVGTPADWYSVGVMLYEALAGRLPFDGAPLEILTRKNLEPPPPLSEVAPGAPHDLAELCSALLRSSPEARPGHREVLALLSGSARGRRASQGPALGEQGPFVGRQEELALLREACAEVEEGHAVTLFVHGESGVGKTALVRAFVAELTRESPRALVLRGRCGERESVNYKALDGVVDELTIYLRNMHLHDLERVLPPDIGYLAEMFPVMKRVPAIAEAARQARRDVAPAELRTRCFAALRQLLDELARQRTLVLKIDDLQWADGDSLAILRELVRTPGEPPLLLLATLRTSPESSVTLGAVADSLAEVTGNVRQLPITGLPRRQAEELARAVATRLARGSNIPFDTLAAETGGHPLYIEELVRFSAEHGESGGRSVRLDEALWARILTLDEKSRHILETVAVAGEAVPQAIVAVAAKLDFEAFSRRVTQLRAASLLRTNGTRRSDRVETFHDKIRAATLAHLDANRQRQLHRRLATALEQTPGAPAEALARHWRGAGDQARATQFALRAAQHATSTLAFEAAARNYRLALELIAPTAPEVPELLARLGEVLSNAGRGAEAGRVYLDAAELGGPGAQESRRKAAEQFLVSGHIDSGLEVLRRVLVDVNLPPPASPKKALFSLVLRRATIALRGLGFKPRRLADLKPAEVERIDTCWSVAIGLGLIDTIRGAEFQARHLLLALSAGEPYRVARALALEYGYVSTGGDKVAGKLAKLAASAEALNAQLADTAGGPHAAALFALVGGIASVCRGDYRDAVERFAAAERQLMERCTGVMWELDSLRMLTLWSSWYTGDVRTIARRAPSLRAEAQNRGDLYAATSLGTSIMPLLRIAEDDPALAREEGEAALRRWTQSGFHFQHYGDLFAQTQVDLYKGDARPALERVDGRWKALQSSMLLSVQQNRLEALHFRSRAELAAAQAGVGNDCLARASKTAKKMLKEKTPWADPLALTIMAGVARVRGDLDQARAHLEAAIPALESRGENMCAHAARLHLGQLLGGDGGAAMVTAARAAMSEQGVKMPARLAATWIPGFPVD